MLEDLSRGDQNGEGVMARVLLDELDRRPGCRAWSWGGMLEIIGCGDRGDQGRLEEIAVDRFSRTSDPETGALYLASVFNIDAGSAMAALTGKLSALAFAEQKGLVERLLPRIFGGRFASSTVNRENLPFDAIERLVGIAFSTIRVRDDNQRPPGVGYTPDERDNAGEARNLAFNCLASIAGRATFDAVLRLGQHPEQPIRPARLRSIARNRAAQDSEEAPWPANEPLEFERSFEVAPRTTKGPPTGRTAGAIDDMQQELLHDDFAQGRTVALLPDERNVQNWVADRLRLKQGRAYSVERESHVVAEKEPDVRLRAKASDASLPIEIKVAGSWTLKQLEAALIDQLCGQYLRAQDARHGILLLVYQKLKPNGWKNPHQKGAFLNLGQVVEHLKVLAAQVAGKSPTAPQPEIALLDVSSCG